MKRKPFLIVLMVAGLGLIHGVTSAADFSAGFYTGYKSGLSFRATAGISNFAMGFPLALEFGITHSRVDAGDPFPARRVFIANATNGTPEKFGYTWDTRLDFLYNLKLTGPTAVYLFAGVRYSMFDAHFDYVGANEEFDITSNQWGVGLGAKGLFAISRHVDFAVTLGFDQFFQGVLHGHDTTYSPDNLNVNAKENFTYHDASAVVNAPRFQAVVMLGLAYNF